MLRSQISVLKLRKDLFFYLHLFEHTLCGNSFKQPIGNGAHFVMFIHGVVGQTDQTTVVWLYVALVKNTQQSFGCISRFLGKARYLNNDDVVSERTYEVATTTWGYGMPVIICHAIATTIYYWLVRLL